MTLHALRLRIGDAAFFRVLKGWAAANAGGNASIPQFIAFAERTSGQQLGDLFDTWPYTPSKPALAGVPAAEAAVGGPIRPASRTVRR